MTRVLSSGEVEDVHGNKINNGEKKKWVMLYYSISR